MNYLIQNIYDSIEPLFFPKGHTYHNTRDILLKGVYPYGSKGYWDRSRRCIGFLNELAKQLTAYGLYYVVNDKKWELTKKKIHNDGGDYYIDIDIEERRKERSNNVLNDTICIDDLYIIKDISQIYGECEKPFNRLYNREYNHHPENINKYNEFKELYYTYKLDGTLTKIEPYMSWLQHEFICNANYIPKHIINLIGCNCCSIINNGCPLESLSYSLSDFSGTQCEMLIDLIQKCFTFKSIRKKIVDSKGEIIYNTFTHDIETDDVITSIRNRYSNNPYSTTCSCDKNIA